MHVYVYVYDYVCVVHGVCLRHVYGMLHVYTQGVTYRGNNNPVAIEERHGAPVATTVYVRVQLH